MSGEGDGGAGGGGGDEVAESDECGSGLMVRVAAGDAMA